MDILGRPWPYLVVAAIAALIGGHVWTQPHHPGTRSFGWVVGVWLVWTLSAAVETVIQSQELRFWLFVLLCVCALVDVPLELIIALEFTGNEKWLARRRLLLLLFLPALVLPVIAFILPDSIASIEYRSGIPFFLAPDLVKWGLYSYVFILISIALGVLFSCLLRAPAFRVPILLFMLGKATPLVGFAVMQPQWIPVAPIQAVVLFMGFSGLAYFMALYNFRLLQVIPVARDMVITNMPYGLIVLDAENHLVDFNAAARTLPGLQQLPVLPGKMALHVASQVLGAWWERIAPLIGPEPVSQDVVIPAPSGEQIFHVFSQPLMQASGWRYGQVLILEDVTQVRQAQQQQAQAQNMLATLRERERLARELHDGLGQTLAATHMQANTARLLLAQGEIIQTEECLEKIADITRTAEADVREYLLGAKTVFSANLRFFQVLRQYVLKFSQQYGLQVELNVPPQLEAQGVPLAVKIQLMRIIQEALSNVRKHAHAKCAQVIFTVSGPLARIVISDDGQGFHMTAVQQAEGFGLQAMRERAEALGGRLDVVSLPGQGTRVVIEVPLQKEPV